MHEQVHGEASPRPHGGAPACRRAGERVGELGAVGAGSGGARMCREPGQDVGVT